MNSVGVLSFKGNFSVSCTKPKPDFTSERAIVFLAGLQKTYPEKIHYFFSKTRGASASASKLSPDDDTCLAINCCIEGCVKAFKTRISSGAITDPKWGPCIVYDVALGIKSSDTGHLNYLTYLPNLEDGCYYLRADFHGKLGKKKSKDRYTIFVDLEVCVMHKSMEEYMGLIERGYIVYPLKLHYPNLFLGDSTSDSEMDTTEDEGEEEEDDEPSHKKKKRTILGDKMRSKIKIMKKTGSSKANTLLRMMRTGNVYPSSAQDNDTHNPASPSMDDADADEDNRDETGPSNQK